MLLRLVVLSVALAAADAQDHLRGSDKCRSEDKDGAVQIFCSLPSGNLLFFFNMSSALLNIICEENFMIVCEELLEAKPFLDKYKGASDNYTILETFMVSGCELSRESLACALGLVGADGSHEVQLNSAVKKLEAAHFEGFKGVTSINIFQSEVNTSIPWNMLSIQPDLQSLTIKESLIELRPCTGSTLSKLSSITLLYNMINTISNDTFKCVPELQKLFLPSNKIQFIDVDAFKGLTKLVNLDLMGNDLSHLSGGVFRHTPSIARLDLSSNTLRALSDDLFAGLNKLQELLIHNNKEVLKLGNKTFSNLPSLSELILEQNNIEHMPAELFQNSTKLEKLLLGGNKIKYLPKAIFKGLKLTRLSLELNEISFLYSDVFSEQTSMTELNLGYNQLKSLPDGLFSKTHSLQYIYLEYNSIEMLTKSTFEGLYNLKELSLASNRIEHLTQWIFECSSSPELLICNNKEVLKLSNKTFLNLPSLSELILEQNNIEHMPAELFQNSTKLEKLLLGGNKIKYLPKAIFKGLKLTRLSLELNEISFLYSDVFSEQTSMTELNLGYNQLKSLPDGLFSKTHSLQYIHLEHNSIELLTKSTFEGLYNLKKLSLASNRIENVTQWIFECSSSPEENDCSFSSDAEIDLRHNNIQQLELPVNKNHTIRARFLVGNNPYRCDCLLYDFIFNYRQRTNMSNIIIKEAECAEPKALKGVRLMNWQPRELTCDVDCATGGIMVHYTKESNCKCILNPIELRLDMFCNHLPSVFPKLPQQIYSTRLKLRHVTNIPSLPPEVKIIDVSSTNLTDLVVFGKSVVLNLTNNYFTKAPLKLFENNCSVYLSNNPIDCSCEGRESVKALHAFKSFIPDYKSLTCSNGVYLSIISVVIDDLCDSSSVVIIIISISIISILIIFFTCINFKYKTELRIMLRRLGLWSGAVHGGELYDAFVSYAHQDENFVIDELLPNLERGNPPLKICIHNRDWVVGDYIPAQIARSVEQSRYTIIVLSSSFVDSVWGHMEFQTAHAKDRVIILMLEDLSADRSLDPELRAYFSMKTYVKADDPLVWERLRDAVLRRRRALKNINENQQLVNIMATTSF